MINVGADEAGRTAGICAVLRFPGASREVGRGGTVVPGGLGAAPASRSGSMAPGIGRRLKARVEDLPPELVSGAVASPSPRLRGRWPSPGRGVRSVMGAAGGNDWDGQSHEIPPFP
jgi:hypothetical protein